MSAPAVTVAAAHWRELVRLARVLEARAAGAGPDATVDTRTLDELALALARGVLAVAVERARKGLRP